MQSESVQFKNIAATPASFALIGGLYQLSAVATWGGGNVVLAMLGPDGTTYLSVSAALTTNGGGTYYLPPGLYQLQVTTATAVYAAVTRIQVN